MKTKVNNENILLNIDKKIDEIKTDVHRIEITQTKMNADLHYHIRRTDILEKNIQNIDNEVQDLENNLEKKIKPYDTLKFTWINIVKFITFLAAIGAVVNVIINYMR